MTTCPKCNSISVHYIKERISKLTEDNMVCLLGYWSCLICGWLLYDKLKNVEQRKVPDSIRDKSIKIHLANYSFLK